MTEARAKRYDVTVSIEVGSQAFIFCDSVEIEQVLINLINNGIDAAKNARERWLKIKIFEDGEHVMIRVVDSGPGISSESEKKLFQPFFTTKPIGEGTGLGLSIAKGILEQHEASIYLNRTITNTCFEVRIKKAEQSSYAA